MRTAFALPLVIVWFLGLTFTAIANVYFNRQVILHHDQLVSLDPGRVVSRADTWFDQPLPQRYELRREGYTLVARRDPRYLHWPNMVFGARSAAGEALPIDVERHSRCWARSVQSPTGHFNQSEAGPTSSAIRITWAMGWQPRSCLDPVVATGPQNRLFVTVYPPGDAPPVREAIRAEVIQNGISIFYH